MVLAGDWWRNRTPLPGQAHGHRRICGDIMHPGNPLAGPRPDDLVRIKPYTLAPFPETLLLELLPQPHLLHAWQFPNLQRAIFEPNFRKHIEVQRERIGSEHVPAMPKADP